jgi:hypothetical protein
MNPEAVYLEFLDTKVNQVKEAGLMDYWISKSIKKPMPMEESGPEVLTLQQLEIGFVIWLMIIGFSSFVFVVEVIVDKIKMRLYRNAFLP